MKVTPPPFEACPRVEPNLFNTVTVTPLDKLPPIFIALIGREDGIKSEIKLPDIVVAFNSPFISSTPELNSHPFPPVSALRNLLPPILIFFIEGVASISEVDK